MKASNGCPPNHTETDAIPDRHQERPLRRREGSIGWHEDICAESKAHVVIGREDCLLSAAGLLMPTGNDQPPPDLRSFQVGAE
jgi:hypothetical protein